MPSSDRAFRALAQAEPQVIIALLRTVAVHVIAGGATVSPEEVGDPRLVFPAPRDADWIARAGNDDMLHLECQGYRDTTFLDRLFCYHLGFVLRYWPRRVETVALWLIVPPAGQRRDTIVVGNVTVQVTSVVVPEIPAELLLSNPRTACFAPGADPGDMSADDLCRKAAGVLRDGGATWLELHMAVVAAGMQGRYKSMTKALDEMNMEPIIIEDLVKIGEDIGFEKGVQIGIERGIEKGITEGLEKGIQQGLEQGLEKGIQQGLERGLEKGIQQGLEKGLEMAREAILETLDVRGIGFDEIARARILAEPSMDQLREWRRRALTESSIDAILGGWPPAGASGR